MRHNAMVVLLVAVLGGTTLGCDSSTTASPPQISSLHFATGFLAGNPPPPNVDIALKDAVKAQAIYDATINLPPFPNGRTNCPGDPGIRYTIDFSNDKGPIVEAVLNPGGCADVVMTGEMIGIQGRQVQDPGYWSTLAQNLGIDESQIYPGTP
jgi:hypothetical protein